MSLIIIGWCDDESAEDNEVYMIKYASPWHAIADIAETVTTDPRWTFMF